jgi:hypothetical protein
MVAASPVSIGWNSASTPAAAKRMPANRDRAEALGREVERRRAGPVRLGGEAAERVDDRFGGRELGEHLGRPLRVDYGAATARRWDDDRLEIGIGQLVLLEFGARHPARDQHRADIDQHVHRRWVALGSLAQHDAAAAVPTQNDRSAAPRRPALLHREGGPIVQGDVGQRFVIPAHAGQIRCGEAVPRRLDPRPERLESPAAMPGAVDHHEARHQGVSRAGMVSSSRRQTNPAATAQPIHK